MNGGLICIGGLTGGGIGGLKGCGIGGLTGCCGIGSGTCRNPGFKGI